MTPALASLLYPKFIHQTDPPGCKRHTYKLQQSIHIPKFKRSIYTVYKKHCHHNNYCVQKNNKNTNITELITMIGKKHLNTTYHTI